MTTFKLGDYAETDRHYGRITFDYGSWSETGRHGHVRIRNDFELQRIECLHGPQVPRCLNFERVVSTQLKPALSPEELAQKLGDDYA